MRKLSMLVIPLLLVLGGCAHYLSEQSRGAADRTAGFGRLRENPEAFRGKLVMLGGVVTAVTHGREGTRLEVEEHRLDSRELPDEIIPSGGRFLATTPEKLDPTRFMPGALVSMAGLVAGKEGARPDGEAHVYPVIAIKEIHDIVIEQDPLWGAFGGM